MPSVYKVRCTSTSKEPEGRNEKVKRKVAAGIEQFIFLGQVKYCWRGKGLKEVGFNKKTGKVHIKVDPVYFRPTDVDELRGDSSKAKRELKWRPKTSFKQLVSEMMESDLKEIN